MDPEKLFNKSIELIISNQSSTGAFIAGPGYDTYNYSWFRDGSYIAHSMDHVGKYQVSEDFHIWVSKTILKHKENILKGIENRKNLISVSSEYLIDTRYVIDGRKGSIYWENFQLDGLGTWLWALGNHLSMSKRKLTKEENEAAKIVNDYLYAHWFMPCFDCWEEHSEYNHIYTLGSIYAGLKEAQNFLETKNKNLLEKIKKRILMLGVSNDHLTKFEGTDLVDSSLLALFTSYRIFDPSSEIASNTVRMIEKELLRENGLHRYKKDTYYGGGLWILLTAWLGLYYSKKKDKDRVKGIINWISEHADSAGRLPEQLKTHVWQPDFVPKWEKKWGQSAPFLLWSHAKYILLYKEYTKMQ